MSDIILDVRDLTVEFSLSESTIHAVNGASYALREGETLGIVGESGSGKSTHALAMMGLIPTPPGRVTAGSVMFRGRDLLTLSRREMRDIRGKEIGMIFQDPLSSLNPVLTIGLQLTEPLVAHLGMSASKARQRACELLDMVGIGNPEQRLKQYPHQFSGGMRQRVMIAMALSCNPRVLIADEATTALDVTVQQQIMDLIADLKQRLGTAIIWITHDISALARIADTVQVMYAGRILERGPVRSVFKDARNAYTLGLLGSIPDIRHPRKRLQQIPGTTPDLTAPPAGDPFAPRNPYATERCYRETPPLRQVEDGADGHLVAAWYDVRQPLSKGGAP